jgi:hypothetical protein
MRCGWLSMSTASTKSETVTGAMNATRITSRRELKTPIQTTTANDMGFPKWRAACYVLVDRVMALSADSHHVVRPLAPKAFVVDVVAVEWLVLFATAETLAVALPLAERCPVVARKVRLVRIGPDCLNHPIQWTWLASVLFASIRFHRSPHP